MLNLSWLWHEDVYASQKVSYSRLGSGPLQEGRRKGTKNGLDRGNYFLGDVNFITRYVGECREALKLYFKLQHLIGQVPKAIVNRAASGIGLVTFIRGRVPDGLTT